MNLTKRSYFEKLRDPRWQRKRLEVMQRDNFKCVDCTESEETLNVHHTFYRKDFEPWEYPLESLVTLCETCHKCREEVKRDAVELFSAMPSDQSWRIIDAVKLAMKFGCSYQEIEKLLEDEAKRRWEAKQQ